MPIYEYACVECDHNLEAIQKMSDAPLTDCPECGAAALRKKISLVGFRLKGNGWYETDFKNGQQKKTESKQGSSESKSSGESKKSSSDSKSSSESK